MTDTSAPYSAPDANDPALAHIHPGLRHLAVPIDDVRLDPANVNKHETILYGSCEERAPEWYGPNNEPTVWEAKKPHASKLHPTEKPLLEGGVDLVAENRSAVVDLAAAPDALAGPGPAVAGVVGADGDAAVGELRAVGDGRVLMVVVSYKVCVRK